jgi:methionyl aminopeptidase
VNGQNGHAQEQVAAADDAADNDDSEDDEKEEEGGEGAATGCELTPEKQSTKKDQSSRQ